MQIRIAKIEELVNIQKLCNAIFKTDIEFDPDCVKNYFTTEVGTNYLKSALTDAKGIFLVAEENGELVGMTNGGEVSYRYRRSKYFGIDNIGVLESHRKTGIGKQLINEIEKFAKEQGFDKIYLQCYSGNKTGLDFYLNNEYHQIDIGFEKTIR